MKAGDTVRVYPHGSPQRAAKATIKIVSERAIALLFEDKPPFVVDKSGGLAIFDGQMAMMATRVEINGKPWGPWVEIFGGGHFEIEEDPPEK